MTNTTVFYHLSASFQFLHVCHYINSIGLLISNDSTSNKQYQIIPVLNAFFDYLNQSDNETNAKQILVQKVLKGTDLYGGKEGETLDTEYIDKTYHYIINIALFSHYGGVAGYLASIVNKASNLNYNYFKKTVKNHFYAVYKSYDPCSSNKSNTRLSLTARTKILEDYLWCIFPPPEHDLNITDVNYIYAMAGYKIVKTLPIIGQLNFTFDEYIQLSHSAEITALQNKSYHLVLEFFSTPALFFYAYKEKVKFQEQNLTSLNAEFWNDAYQMLFSYLNETVEMLVQDALKNSLYYKLQTDISLIKTRTALAEMILKVACPNVSDPVSLKYLIDRYKSQSVSQALLFIETIADMMDYTYYNCSNLHLPILNQLFYTQFDNVKNTYYEIEKNSIQQALAAGDLLSRINSPNASVEKAKLPDLLSFCNTCGPNLRSIEEDIYFFFAIKEDSKTEFYAFKQEENSLTLIKNEGNEEIFAKALGVDSSIKPQTHPISIFLKKQQENSTVFVEGLAKIKTDQYIAVLQEYYYEPTLVEKVMNFFFSLVPFYTCVSNINSGNAAEAVLSCSIDIMSLLPVAGVASKYLNLIRSSFTFHIGKTLTAIRAVSRGVVTYQVAIRTGISEIFQAARTVTSQLLTQPIIRDLSIALIRTMDPGIEMIYSLSRYGIRFLWRLFDKILLHTKNFMSFGRFSDQLKSMLSFLRRVMGKNVDHTGLVPRIVGREPGLEVVRYTYPAGVNFFGPKCLKVFGYTVEMRTSFEDMRQIPVVRSKIDGDTVHYKKIDLDTGTLFDYELMLDNNDLLQRIRISAKLMVMKTLGNHVRNYDVYYNTIGGNQPLKRKIVLEKREDAASFAARVGNRRGASKIEKGDKSHTSLQENQRVDEGTEDHQAGPSRRKKVFLQRRIDDKIESNVNLESNVPKNVLQENQRVDEGTEDHQAGPSRRKKVFLQRRIDDKIESNVNLESNVPKNVLQENQRVDEGTEDHQAGPSRRKKVFLQRRIDDKIESNVNLESNVPAEKGIETNLKSVKEPDTSLQENRRIDIEESDINYRPGPSQEKKVSFKKIIDAESKSDNTLGYNNPLEKDIQPNLKYDEESGFDIDNFIEERSKGIDKNDLKVQDNSGFGIEQVRIGPEQEQSGIDLLRKGNTQGKEVETQGLDLKVPHEGTRVSGMNIDENLSELLKHLKKHDSSLPKSPKLVESSTEQKRNMEVADGSKLEAQGPEFDIDKFVAERAKEVSGDALKTKVLAEKGLETNLKYVKEPDTSLQENQRPNLEESDNNYQAGPSQEKKVLLDTKIDDKSKSDTTLGFNVPVERDIHTNLKNDEESGFDIDSFIKERSKGIDKYDLGLQDNSGLGIEQVRIDPEQDQSVIDLLRKGNTQRKEVETQGLGLKAPNEDTRVSGMDIDDNLSKLLNYVEKHYFNLQKSHELVQGATGQERDSVVTDGSKIEAQSPDFDIDEFLAERAKQLDFNTQQANEDLRSLSNSRKVSNRKNNFKMIKDLRSWQLGTEEDLKVGLNPTPMTDFNTVVKVRNQFQQLTEYRHYYNDVRRAADMYRYFDKINRILSFDDYLVLWLQVMGDLPGDFEVNRKAIVATYRMALKQSSQNWINDPIKLYRFKVTSMDVVGVYEKLKNNDVVTLSNFMLCFDNLEIYEITWKSARHKHPILFEFTLSNQYGVADFERIMPVKGLHAISSGIKFRIDNVVREYFQGMSILKIQMSDSQFTSEMKLSNVQHKLKILS